MKNKRILEISNVREMKDVSIELRRYTFISGRCSIARIDLALVIRSLNQFEDYTQELQEHKEDYAIEVFKDWIQEVVTQTWPKRFKEASLKFYGEFFDLVVEKGEVVNVLIKSCGQYRIKEFPRFDKSEHIINFFSNGDLKNFKDCVVFEDLSAADGLFVNNYLFSLCEMNHNSLRDKIDDLNLLNRFPEVDNEDISYYFLSNGGEVVDCMCGEEEHRRMSLSKEWNDLLGSMMDDFYKILNYITPDQR